jgi:sialate O-acetylesterase
MTRTFFLKAFLILFVCGLTVADIKLPSVIGNNMVLQRNGDASIWGWGNTGEKVTLTASWQKNIYSAIVDEDGKWSVKVATPKAGGPYTLTIKGENEITLKNVMIGEVWLCGGQSNMAMAFYREKKAGDKTIIYKIDNHEQERLAADYPDIRVLRAKANPWHSETPVDDVRGSWQVCAPDMAKNMPAVPYFFGRELHRKLDVPIGLIVNAVPATRIEPWTNPAGFDSVPELKSLISESKKQDIALKDKPGVLYNTLVHPLVPYAIRGAIWYQGESNLGDHMVYYHKMRALINGWRQVWRQGDFPFYFVQLAPCGGFYEDMQLPKLWEAQAAVLSIKNTGMALNSDISDLDLHPANKQDVGKRLANWALAKDYAIAGIVYDGPRYKSMQILDGKIRINFDNAAGSLQSRDGKPLDWFTIAGDDKIFVPAKAKIEGSEVVVYSENVARPIAVRFGWKKEAQPNLMNAKGLPAYPFRTDDWSL